MNWTKFCVWFKIDDNEVWSVLASRCEEYSHKFTVDEMLTVVVNISHSLAVDASKLFDVVNVELTNWFTD